MLGPVAGWALFVGGGAAIVVGALASGLAVVGMLAVLGLALLALVSGMVAGSIGSGTQVVGNPGSGLWQLEPRVQEWASDDLPHEQLWRLNAAYRRVRELRTIAIAYFDKNGEEYPADAEWGMDEVLRPALVAEFDRRVAELEAVAGELGFELSESDGHLP